MNIDFQRLQGSDSYNINRVSFGRVLLIVINKIYRT